MVGHVYFSLGLPQRMLCIIGNMCHRCLLSAPPQALPRTVGAPLARSQCRVIAGRQNPVHLERSPHRELEVPLLQAEPEPSSISSPVSLPQGIPYPTVFPFPQCVMSSDSNSEVPECKPAHVHGVCPCRHTWCVCPAKVGHFSCVQLFATPWL